MGCYWLCGTWAVWAKADGADGLNRGQMQNKAPFCCDALESWLCWLSCDTDVRKRAGGSATALQEHLLLRLLWLVAGQLKGLWPVSRSGKAAMALRGDVGSAFEADVCAMKSSARRRCTEFHR